MIEIAQAAGDSVSWLEVLREYGAIAVMAVLIVALVKGMVFTRAAVDELKEAYEKRHEIDKERLEEAQLSSADWKQIALEGTGLLEKSITLAERRHERRPS